jgi:hypothetical protein
LMHLMQAAGAKVPNLLMNESLSGRKKHKQLIPYFASPRHHFTWVGGAIISRKPAQDTRS